MKGFWVGLVALAFVSCKGKEEAASQAAVSPGLQLSKEVPADFIQFYMKFFADTTYQLSHIVFPLQMKSDGSYWQKEDWTYHVPFSDDTGEFVQEFQHINGLVFESISDSKKLFQVTRRYSKADNGYNLIYYTKQNAFENTEGWEEGE